MPPILRLPIETGAEVRIAILLVGRDRQLEITSEDATLVVRADRVATGVRTVGRATVVANEPAEVAQPESPAKRPERLLTEQQVDASVRRARVGERRQRRRRPPRMRSGRGWARRGKLLWRRAKRVQNRHHSSRVARLKCCFCFNEARVETGGDGNGRRRAPQAVDLDDERAAILRLHGVLSVRSDLVVRRNATVIRREERDCVFHQNAASVALNAVANGVAILAGRLIPQRVCATRQRRRDVVAEGRRNRRDQRGGGRRVAQPHSEQRTRLTDSRRTVDRNAGRVGPTAQGHRGVERRARHREHVLDRQRLAKRSRLAGTVAERNAVAEVRSQLHLGESASEVHLGDVRRRQRLVLVEQADRLGRRRTHTVKCAQRVVHGRVVELDLALVGLVVLHERRAGRPFVHQKAAKQPGALAVSGCGAEPRQRAVAHRRCARGRLHRGRIDDRGVDRLEQVVLEGIARRETEDGPYGECRSDRSATSHLQSHISGWRRVRS